MNPETPESPAFGDVSAAVEPVVLRKRMDAPVSPGSTEMESLQAFRTAARALKAAEDALIQARQAYAEAVKALSEEAVR